MQRLYINPDYANLLATEELDSYEELYTSDLAGEVVSTCVNRTTRRVELGGRGFYLKRVYKPRPHKALEALLKLNPPHHYCWREMQQVQSLHEAGFPVMDVAAAGETTRFGVPVHSFILAPEVAGVALDQAFGSSDEERRCALLAQLGNYTARLHSAGFFTPVRMKDVICSNSGEMVLIDRETRHPGRHRFTGQRASDALFRTFHRERRDGTSWSEKERIAYCEAYRDTIADKWQPGDEELLRICQL